MKWIVATMTVLVLGLGISAQKKADLIPETAKFSPDQAISYTKDYSTPSLPGSDAYKPQRFATGTLNGVAYRFYFSDGSGSIEAEKGSGIEYRPAQDIDARWSVSCKKDAIDDSRMCYLNRGSGLFVFVMGDGSMRVDVGGTQTPGSNIAIRIDDAPAFVANEKAGFTGMYAREIVVAMKSGRSVVTRYSEFGRGQVDNTFGTYGFAEAMAYLQWAIANIK